MSRIKPAALAFGLSLACAFVVAAMTARSQSTSSHASGPAGKEVYRRANCIGCHKWHGDGGGGYGGAALSLRRTELDREQMMEVIRCGRPATGMPYHLPDAYDRNDKPCHGLARQDLGDQMPPTATAFLRQPEIEAVTDYVLANIKGKGEVRFDDCVRFFGEGSRMCNLYQAMPHQAAPAPGNNGGTSSEGR
jgi:mono/diheme cytochrome c family protein